MLVSTTHTLEGHDVDEYLGIVTGEVIAGANFVRDIFASFTDIVGGRSKKYENVLKRGREEAIEEMQYAAIKMGADAVIGVDLDYEVVGKGGSMLMISATGTAVKFKQSVQAVR
ncbi:YbjQ family protein [Sphingorhabdus sp. Alg239-R122]|uniref:YbjQ family protein n=1 Tax=Sphingorhabdus sp. Alg239-R122 TaxID=2305989 RepID=UPI0013DD7612|nr:YbjQ family protein [Sphingorhabdus sp. Alg239-R122]